MLSLSQENMNRSASNPVNLGRRLAEYLRELRRRREVTQYDICNATGIAHTTYRRYERNDADSNAGISLDALCALATFDGCSVGELLASLDDAPSSGTEGANGGKEALHSLFRDVPEEDMKDFLDALRNFEPDRAIASPVVWLVRLATVLLKSERRFQLRVERDVLDQGINSETFSQKKIDGMISRLEQIIREQFKRR